MTTKEQIQKANEKWLKGKKKKKNPNWNIFKVSLTRITNV